MRKRGDAGSQVKAVISGSEGGFYICAKIGRYVNSHWMGVWDK